MGSENSKEPCDLVTFRLRRGSASNPKCARLTVKQHRVADTVTDAYVKRDHVPLGQRAVSGHDATENSCFRCRLQFSGRPCATGLVKGLDCVSVLLAPPLGCPAPLLCLAGDPFSSQTHWPILLPLSTLRCLPPSSGCIPTLCVWFPI